MSDILITEKIQGLAIDALGQSYDVKYEPNLWQNDAALRDAVGKTRAMIVRNQTQVTRALIAGGNSLKVIGRAGAGLDNIDVAAACEQGIVVTSTPEQNSLSVAELTLGLMLALARHIPAADRDTRVGNWSRQKFTGVELYGSTVGIVGFGRIGFLTAMRAQAMGMRVVISDPVVGPDAATVNAVGGYVLPLEQVLGAADFICCHVPCTPSTRLFFNADRFAQTKQGAYFINTSRGEVVDELALASVLKSKHLAGAGLDVRSTEPPTASVFDQMDNVILTPHIAAFTDQAQDRVIKAVCLDVAGVLEGKTPNYPA
ncbi:MAG: hydroxyacid dehydrogenase [Phycisphaeraceae bacterium]|nr:hydroxyacid dehydrogenase [Phycisphaeraceae bacterium]